VAKERANTRDLGPKRQGVQEENEERGGGSRVEMSKQKGERGPKSWTPKRRGYTMT